MLGFLKRGVQQLARGSSGPLRGCLDGALAVQDAHARYQEAVLNGNVWIGANPVGTPVTTQAGLSATTPALVLYNPINSPVNLVLWHAEAIIQASPAAAAGVLLAYNNVSLAGVPTGPTTVTLANITNALLAQGSTGTSTVSSTQGGGGPWGQCYRVSTLSAAPIGFRYLFGTTGASAIGGMGFRDQIDGAVFVPPGVAVSFQATSAAALICSFCWEEVPIF